MQVITIGLDLAKNVFQVHGVDAAGTAVIRKLDDVIWIGGWTMMLVMLMLLLVMMMLLLVMMLFGLGDG